MSEETPRSNRKKMIATACIVVTLVGIGGLLLSGLLKSPFDEALEDLMGVRGVAFYEQHGTGNGQTGKDVCYSLADYMENWCAQENLKCINNDEPFSFNYDSTSYPYSEQALAIIKDTLERSVLQGIVTNSQVDYNRNVKIITFQTYESLENSGITIFLIRDYFLYFD